MKTTTMQAILMIMLSVFFTLTLSAQTINICGKIEDLQDGMPLAGVAISVQENNQIIYSDSQGKFNLQAKIGTQLYLSKQWYYSDTIIVKSERIEIIMRKIVSYTIQEKLANLPGASSVDGQIVSVRGNRSDGQVTLIDGVKIRSSQLEKKGKYFQSAVPMSVESNESYESFGENKFKSADKEPLSTFSLDVDAASY